MAMVKSFCGYRVTYHFESNAFLRLYARTHTATGFIAFFSPFTLSLCFSCYLCTASWLLVNQKIHVAYNHVNLIHSNEQTELW